MNGRPQMSCAEDKATIRDSPEPPKPEYSLLIRMNWRIYAAATGVAVFLAFVVPIPTLGQDVEHAAFESSSLNESRRSTQPDRKISSLPDPAKRSVTPGITDLPCGFTAGPVVPGLIMDQGTVTIGNNIYTFAGVSNGSMVGTARKFDGTTWTPLAAVPVSLEYPTVVTDGTYAYIINGVDEFGTIQNTVYRYDPATNTYATLAPSPSESGSWNAAGAYLSGKIYKIGGYGNFGALATVDIYDIASNTWSVGAPYPLALGWMSAFVRDGSIYVAGGLPAGSVGSASAKTFRFDPVNNNWDDNAIADLPISRWGAATSQTSVYNGWVLAGGYVGGAGFNNISSTVIYWSPQADTWLEMPSMPEVRARMTGSVLNGVFHVIGGRGPEGGFQGNSSNYKLSCAANQPFVTGRVSFVSDDGTPQNGVPDPGETVTINLTLYNIGGANTSAVTATLQNSGGITEPSGPVNVGVINSGSAVSQNFTFRVPSVSGCGGIISLTFDVAEGTRTYTVQKTFRLGILQVSFSENFDHAIIPSLPPGWLTSTAGEGPAPWLVSNVSASSSPNAAFVNDPDTAGESRLDSPPLPIGFVNAPMSFRIKYRTDYYDEVYDGAVLEVKIGTGQYQDIMAAGGSFVGGGYNSTISECCSNPLAGRPAWGGYTSDYVPVSITLPPAAAGQNIQLRWRMGSDSYAPGVGVWVDDLNVLGSAVCSAVRGRAPYDFDGDRRSDLSVFRPSNAVWYLDRSTQGFTAVQFGLPTDKIVPADYDGDGKTDIAIFRDGTWWRISSSTSTVLATQFGIPGDIPLPGDYNGDGRDELGVYRNGEWWHEGAARRDFGLASDKPVPADYDGDGKTDIAIYRDGVWWRINSSNGAVEVVQFGLPADRPVVGDYDGDSKADLAVYRDGTWYLQRSTAGFGVFYWGLSTDTPAPADYDGDGKTDAAVFRLGVWYLLNSTGGVSVQQFGLAGDTPAPAAYVP